MTTRNPLPACLAHLAQRGYVRWDDADVEALRKEIVTSYARGFAAGLEAAARAIESSGARETTYFNVRQTAVAIRALKDGNKKEHQDE